MMPGAISKTFVPLAAFVMVAPSRVLPRVLMRRLLSSKSREALWRYTKIVTNPQLLDMTVALQAVELALAEHAGKITRELANRACGLARNVRDGCCHRVGPPARVRREVVANRGLVVVIEAELRDLLDHRRDGNRHVLHRLADRFADRAREISKSN